MTLNRVATEYLEAGLCVLPAILEEKRPSLPGWKHYQQRLPTQQQIESWFRDGGALCVLTGAVSGNLELIDFDHGGELFDAWWAAIAASDPALVEYLVVERSQSGGRHVVYRCEEPIDGSRKLAQRTIVVEGPDPLEIAGRQYLPRAVADRFEITLTLIETRGEGGLFLCAPTPGYVLERGSFSAIPRITAEQRARLLETGRSLSEVALPVNRAPIIESANGRPGDDFNERGDVRSVLQRHGWTLVKPGQNEYWRRPGKTTGWSATLRDNILYVFSSSASPFEPDQGYPPFSVYALLEHAGDFSAAAAKLGDAGYGHAADGPPVDLSALIGRAKVNAGGDPPSSHPDPGPLPMEMYRVPGFVSEVMDHCLETAPYPNVPLAFCGALALQALLAGRKVRDAGDNRTNLYVLALAYSSVGKDWPRKVNTHVLHHVGLVDSLGEKFASGEGIQDSLFRTPSMLFQTDEIDGLLQSINKSQDARYENILGTLLTLYSAGNSIFPMRRKAGTESAGVIDQPCLVVYGTAIPTHYYAALSERMLTNGFFARMLIVESGPRSVGQEPGIISPPPRVLEAARWWSEFCPGNGNLDRFHPVPYIVAANAAASTLLTEARQAAEAEYAKSETRGDPVGTTVWGRVPEQIRKLALLYSVSKSHEAPLIDVAAVRWASDFVLHQTRRMLFMAHNHVAENPFHAGCLKLLRKLREAPNQTLPHSVLLKRMKLDAKSFQELITTLEQQGDVQVITTARAGSALRAYRLVGEVNAGGEK